MIALRPGTPEVATHAPAPDAASNVRPRGGVVGAIRGPGDYVAAAERYVDGVLAGTIPAARPLRLACERHRRDRKRAILREFPYYFDVDAAERPCEFGEMLPHVKGKWARHRLLIRLGDWQCFILCSIFGWRVKPGRPREGLRRFLSAYLEIPRKNGKSVLAAIIGLFMWSMDGEAGAEVYSGATTESQAWEVFRPARLMVAASAELVQELGERCVRAKKLVIEEDHSRFEPMIGKPGDGASPSCAIVDEFHEHDTSDMVDTMETGMLAREQPLLLAITTAGVNLAGPCYDKRDIALKVLDGSFDDDSSFVVIYTLDETDDWADPKTLPKANPNFGVSVDADILLAKQRTAVLDPSGQTPFKTKHQNIWCAARHVWMPLDVWDLCTDPSLSIDEFEGEPYFGILDLASKDDIACYLRWFRKKVRDKWHHYVFPKYYLPESVLEVPGPNQIGYKKWALAGLLTMTPGKEIDFDKIEEDVLADKSRFQHLELLYDPWRATQLAQHMEKSGATVVELRQTVQNMSTPMKEVLSAAKAARIHHDGNKATRWMMSNVTAQLDAKDNIYPRKEKNHMKIDGPVCIIMGMGRAMLEEDGSFEEYINSLKGGGGQHADHEEAAA